MLTARALGCGVIVAVVLASAYTWADATISGEYALLTPAGATSFAAIISSLTAVQALIVCVPLWLLFERFGWDSWLAAAGLGFIAAPISWLVTNRLEGSVQTVPELLQGTLPYSLCGAAAGLTIWLMRPRRGT